MVAQTPPKAARPGAPRPPLLAASLPGLQPLPAASRFARCLQPAAALAPRGGRLADGVGGLAGTLSSLPARAPAFSAPPATLLPPLQRESSAVPRSEASGRFATVPVGSFAQLARLSRPAQQATASPPSAPVAVAAAAAATGAGEEARAPRLERALAAEPRTAVAAVTRGDSPCAEPPGAGDLDTLPKAGRKRAQRDDQTQSKPRSKKPKAMQDSSLAAAKPVCKGSSRGNFVRLQLGKSKFSGGGGRKYASGYVHPLTSLSSPPYLTSHARPGGGAKPRKSSKFSKFKRRPVFADSAAPPAPLLVDDLWAGACLSEPPTMCQTPPELSADALAALAHAQSAPGAETLQGAVLRAILHSFTPHPCSRAVPLLFIRRFSRGAAGCHSASHVPPLLSVHPAHRPGQVTVLPGAQRAGLHSPPPPSAQPCAISSLRSCFPA